MDWMIWYDGLAKPSWAPSPPTIGLIRQISIRSLFGGHKYPRVGISHPRPPCHARVTRGDGETVFFRRFPPFHWA